MRDKLKQQKKQMLADIQFQNDKIEEDCSQFLETDYREQYLLDQKLLMFHAKFKDNRQELNQLDDKLREEAKSREDYRRIERIKKVQEEEAIQEIAERAE